MAWLPRTVTGKFTLLLSVFLILQTVQLTVAVIHLSRVSHDSGLINDAGRQRMRTLLLEHMTAQVLQPNADPVRYRHRLVEEIDRYEEVLRRLRERAQRVGANRDLLVMTADARSVWENELKPVLVGIDPTRRAQVRTAVTRYSQLADAQLARLNRIVGLLEQDVRDDTRRLSLYHVILLSSILLMCLIAVLVARRNIVAPLQNLVDATRAIAAGAYDRRVHVFAEDELGVLADSYNHMAKAVADKTKRLSTLNQIAVDITATLGVDDLLDRILRHGIALTATKAVAITLYDEKSSAFGGWVARGLSDTCLEGGFGDPGGLIEQAFTTGGYALSTQHPKMERGLGRLAELEGIQVYGCFPLTSRGHRLGVLCFYCDSRDTLLPEEIGLLSTFTHLAAGAIDNARLHAATVDLAETDSLTGLSNRRLFEERLDLEIQRAKHFSRSFALVILDIDYFKQTNDTYGHPAGDVVLKEVGARLSRQLRAIDLAARYGGEEFALILPQTETAVALRTADRLRHAIAEAPFQLPDGSEINMTASVGVACFPHCAEHAESMVACADQALYLAKRAGRDCCFCGRGLTGAGSAPQPCCTSNTNQPPSS